MFYIKMTRRNFRSVSLLATILLCLFWNSFALCDDNDIDQLRKKTEKGDSSVAEKDSPAVKVSSPLSPSIIENAKYIWVRKSTDKGVKIELIKDLEKVEKLKKALSVEKLDYCGKFLISTSYTVVLLDANKKPLLAGSYECGPKNKGWVFRLYHAVMQTKDGFEIGGEPYTIKGNWDKNISYTEYVIPIKDGLEIFGENPGF
jgi:hypothetical protein